MAGPKNVVRDSNLIFDIIREAASTAAEKKKYRKFVMDILYGMITMRGSPADNIHGPVYDRLRGVLNKYEEDEDALSDLYGAIEEGSGSDDDGQGGGRRRRRSSSTRKRRGHRRHSSTRRQRRHA